MSTMLPAVMVQVGIGLLSAYGVLEYFKTSQTYSGHCGNSWDLHKTLSQRLYGQSEAVYDLTDFMINDLGPYGVQTCLVYGGPGVGKSHLVSLLKSLYRPQEKLVHINPKIESLNKEETFKMATDRIKSVVSGFGLIVIDSVAYGDETLINFLYKLNTYCKENHLRVKVLVITKILQMYSNPNSNLGSVTDFKNHNEYLKFLKETINTARELYKRHSPSSISFHHVLFRPMSLSSVRQCILEVVNQRLGRKQVLIDNLVQDVLTGIIEGPQDFVPSGCLDVEKSVILLSLW